MGSLEPELTKLGGAPKHKAEELQVFVKALLRTKYHIQFLDLEFKLFFSNLKF